MYLCSGRSGHGFILQHSREWGRKISMCERNVVKWIDTTVTNRLLIFVLAEIGIVQNIVTAESENS